MNFSEIINYYLSYLDCNAKELAEKSGISASAISRYRKSQRTPTDSEATKKICNAFCLIAKEKNLGEEACKKINEDFMALINSDEVDKKYTAKRMNLMIDLLDINASDLATYMNYAPSYISKIRTSSRFPQNKDLFFDKLVNYIYLNKNDDLSIRIISDLLECDKQRLCNETIFKEELKKWFFIDKENYNNIQSFLNNLDSFNLDEYIKSINFDSLKVPKAPVLLKSSKYYYNLEEMKNAELEFLKATVLSKKADRVFMFSTMKMDDMAADMNFAKKWMFGIALMLKKGLKLDIIHNLNRPFNELMLGLECWIPLYMTGQISPYYLKHKNDEIIEHIDYCSGSVALSGESVVGHHNKGMYYVTKKPNEISYYKKKAELILKKANHLMKIYKSEDKNKFTAFLEGIVNYDSNRKSLLTVPPIYTINEELFIKILSKSKLLDNEKDVALQHYKLQKESVLKILGKHNIYDKINYVDKETFVKNPLKLNLCDIFFEKEINYEYEDYIEHINQTKVFANKHKYYSCEFEYNKRLSNIDIRALNNQTVIITKFKSPTIHFVINHKTLNESIEKFIDE